MGDYFRHLVARSLQPQVVIQPRLAGRYEPLQPGGSFWAADQEEDFSTVEDGKAAGRPGVPFVRVKTAPAGPVEAPQVPAQRAPADHPAGPILRPVSQSLPPAPASNGEEDPGALAPKPVFLPRTETQAAPAARKSEVEHRAGIAPPAHNSAFTAQPAARTTKRAGSWAAQFDPAFSRRSPKSRPAPPILELKPVLAPSPEGAEYSAQNAPALAEPAPVVHITIGRIEVRRASTPKAASPARKSRIAPAVMNLEEYLKKRNGGGG